MRVERMMVKSIVPERPVFSYVSFTSMVVEMVSPGRIGWMNSMSMPAIRPPRGNIDASCSEGAARRNDSAYAGGATIPPYGPASAATGSRKSGLVSPTLLQKSAIFSTVTVTGAPTLNRRARRVPTSSLIGKECRGSSRRVQNDCRIFLGCEARETQARLASNRDVLLRFSAEFPEIPAPALSDEELALFGRADRIGGRDAGAGPRNLLRYREEPSLLLAMGDQPRGRMPQGPAGSASARCQRSRPSRRAHFSRQRRRQATVRRR